MAVRTARLAVGSSAPAGSLHVAYTCPAGRTAIVKDIRLYSGGGAVTQVAMSMRSGPTTVALFVVGMAAQEVRDRTGFIVLEPGDDLTVFSTGGVFTYWVGGAELDGVAP